MNATVVNRPRAVMSNVGVAVYEQLPRDLQNKLAVAIEQDPHMHRVIAHFYRKISDTAVSDKDWAVQLEPREVDGVMCNIGIPDVELARLCLEVV